MPSSFKYKGPQWKKKSAISLREENAFLKKSLFELSRQHSEHNRLLEKFVSLETQRLTISHKLMEEGERTDAPSVHHIGNEGNPVDPALENNKQQQEAYVRALLARVSSLEEQLNEAKLTQSQQHNKDHSDESDQIQQMLEDYERFLHRAKDMLETVRELVRELVMELVDLLKADIQKGQSVSSCISDKPMFRCAEVDEFKQQQQGPHLYSEDEEQNLKKEIFELQMFMVNRHHADQEKIADLERQLKILSQDLEDEKEDSSYLKTQMVKVLKMLKKTDVQSKKEPESTKKNWMSSPSSRVLNESFLECPHCQVDYPVSQYRELMNHIETCPE